MAVIRSIAKILTLRCREAAELVSAAQDGTLGPAERWALRLHLAICAPCRRFRKQLASIRAMLGGVHDRLEGDLPLLDDHLSPDARGRLQQLIDSQPGD